MHFMKWKITGLRLAICMFMCVTVGLVHGPLVASGLATEAEQDNVQFKWAFGALIKSEDGSERKLETVTQDRVLKTGDQLKMMVEPETRCFVYLIYFNSQGEVKLLFPYTMQQFENDYDLSKKYYIPESQDAWLELDNHPGTETFYLMASVTRLADLEGLLGQYNSAEPDKKAEVAKQIQTKIHDMKKEHRDLTTAAERPVRIGGAIRSVEKPRDISTIADKIVSTEFFARTFTVDHQ